MKFLYKINSSYDGFRPSRLEERLDGDGRLRLGWAHYLDAVDEGAEVWVYFKGPASHRFEHGVYAKGVVEVVDMEARAVRLGHLELDAQTPLTDAATGARVAEVVRRWGQQVFIFPEELEPVAVCTIGEDGASSCGERRCGHCATWRSLPRVAPLALGNPDRLGDAIDVFVPAFWVIPPRSFIYYTGRAVADGVKRTSEVFHRFKFGEANLAHPLALGIREQLREHAIETVDAVVPIPLSPDKEQSGEIHRTLLIANELARLVAAPVVEALELDRPISKRSLQRRGVTDSAFEAAYRAALVLDEDAARDWEAAILVDDVCTKGSTLTVAAEAIAAVNADCLIVAATGGQMVVRAAVREEDHLLV